MRHAEPQPGHPMDGTRQLTSDGVKQAEEMSAFMVRWVGQVGIVICSPFARSEETAAIMAKALGSHTADSRMIQPDGEPADMWAEIERLAQQSKDVLVVGHDPSLQKLMFWMMGKDGDENDIKFKHGAIAHLRGGGQEFQLHWLVTPMLIERDRDEQEVLEAARALWQIASAG